MNKMQRWSYPQVLSKLNSLAEMNGIHFTKVNPAYTSQTCSNCGSVKQEMPLEIRTYECCECSYIEDRDINAAKNILAEAKNIANI